MEPTLQKSERWLTTLSRRRNARCTTEPGASTPPAALPPSPRDYPECTLCQLLPGSEPVSWLWRPCNYRLSQVQQSSGRNEGSLGEAVREMWAGTSPSPQTELLRSDLIRRNQQCFLAEENARPPLKSPPLNRATGRREDLCLELLAWLGHAALIRSLP